MRIDKQIEAARINLNDSIKISSTNSISTYLYSTVVDNLLNIKAKQTEQRKLFKKMLKEVVVNFIGGVTVGVLLGLMFIIAFKIGYPGK